MSETSDEPPLGTLLTQLLADGRAVARAEIEVVRQTALAKLAAAQQALIFLAVALLLSIAAATVLLIGLAMVLAHWLGPPAATLVVAILAFAIAGLLARWAVRKLAAAGSAKPDGGPS
jgi:hypothetical protein